LVEALVASVILAVVASGTAIALMSSNRLQLQGSNRTRIDTLIDADINKLKNAADNYTYCSGSYTWSGATCNGVGPQNERYYFPAATDASSTAAVAFANACANGTMTDSLRTAMNGGDTSLALSSAATAMGITRSQVTLDDAASHRLRVDYNAPSLDNPRRILIIPIAAAWCP
jgi:type II secretory pathway pseudopilin PulG